MYIYYFFSRSLLLDDHYYVMFVSTFGNICLSVYPKGVLKNYIIQAQGRGVSNKMILNYLGVGRKPLSPFFQNIGEEAMLKNRRFMPCTSKKIRGDQAKKIGGICSVQVKIGGFQ